MDEIYDVVDKKGKKVGNATWTQVHTLGLFHQVVHGFVFSDPTRDKILIQKRSKNAAQGPGQMESSVAGHLIAGESAKTGICRELEEELFGLKSLPTNIKIKKICSYFNNDLPGNYEIAHLFEIIYSGPVQRQVEETEQPPMWVKRKR